MNTTFQITIQNHLIANTIIRLFIYLIHHAAGGVKFPFYK